MSQDRMTVNILASELRSHVTDCMDERKETTRVIGELSAGLTANTKQVAAVKDVVDGYQRASKRVVGWVVGSASFIIASVATAAITVVVTNQMNHVDTAAKTEIAARTAARYTAEDAQKDRAVQDARDQQIMLQLGRLQASVEKTQGGTP